MNPIEPNLAGLAWFVALWSIGCLGFLQIAGMYPLGAASPRHRAPVLVTSALWLALVSGPACLPGPS